MSSLASATSSRNLRSTGSHRQVPWHARSSAFQRPRPLRHAAPDATWRRNRAAFRVVRTGYTHHWTKRPTWFQADASNWCATQVSVLIVPQKRSPSCNGCLTLVVRAAPAVVR